ncbi:MAG: hypothetical protein M1829_004966 [Trizodia sp. TS-e1964]|nr:MAG: hypothetical protein M1829_004966 [Trizodia sp. TS-e1964]
MASNHPGQCCTTGVKHEGKTVGEILKIGDVEAYVVHPASKSTEYGIVLFPDVIGHKFNNTQLIADAFAQNGYFVVVPDIYHGDPAPLNPPAEFKLIDWVNGTTSSGKAGHTLERIEPVVHQVIKWARQEKGVKRLGGAGYCFGARYVVRELQPGQLDAGFIAHPSFMTHDEVTKIKGPLSIAAAETDGVFTIEQRRDTEEVLRKLPFAWQINLYSGVQHGFSLRGDPSVKVVKFAKEKAFQQALDWFDEHLK